MHTVTQTGSLTWCKWESTVRTKYFKTSCYHQEVLLHSPSTSAENCRQVYHVDVPFKKSKKQKKQTNLGFFLQERKEGVWAGGGSGPAEGPRGSAPHQGCQPQHLPEREAKPGGWGEWPEGPAGQGESLGLRGRSDFWLLLFCCYCCCCFKHRMSSSEYPLRFFFSLQ